MKKIIYLLGLSMALLMSSCSQDEVFYSCNEEEDTFVKDNLKEIQKMTRGEWLESSQDLKLPMYRAFTAEQKQQFWKEKIEKVMNCYSWTEEELNHLIALRDAVVNHEYWFMGKKRMSEQEQEDFEVFEYRWTEYAKSVRLWSEKLVGSIVYTGEEIEVVDKEPIVKSVTAISKKRVRSSGESKYGDCNCRESGEPFNCLPFSCLTGLNVCDRTDGGCGFLKGVDCNGYCI